jgi:hypothetical protein
MSRKHNDCTNMVTMIPWAVHEANKMTIQTWPRRSRGHVCIVILFTSFTGDRRGHVCIVILFTSFTGDRRGHVCIMVKMIYCERGKQND